MAGADVLGLILRGVAIGALVSTAFGLWRGGAGQPARVAGLLLTLSVIGYTLQSSAPAREALGAFSAITHVLAFSGSAFFWLFIVTLFEDWRITPLTLSPAALLTFIGLAGWLGRQPENSPLWLGHNVIEIGLAGHALFVVARSWRGDLVEARRRLRGPFLTVATLFVVILAGFEIVEAFGVTAWWYPLAGALALAAFATTGAAVFLSADPALFGSAAPAKVEAPSDGLDAGARLDLERLAALMGEGEAWRREGLAIGALAQELAVPEHRLRRLINDHLGHRNFAAFVNAHRIEAAKRLLADPGKARTPVSAVAFELGFGSLGPFNRAFKEVTGATPTEWRSARLAESRNS